MFLKNCIVRSNSKYINDELNNLGYKLIENKNSKNTINDIMTHKEVYTYTNLDGHFGVCNNHDSLSKDDRIDCGTNIKLFLWISALRDDTDYMQWFINNETKEWYIHKPHWKYGCRIDAFKILKKGKWHKASIEELINYFK